MENNNSASLDKWREFFRTSNSDIFDLIEHAIMVAASDCPYDFKRKRDRIAEMLFTCKQTKCSGCEKFGLAVPCDKDARKNDERNEAGGSKDTNESKAHSDSNNRDSDHMEMMNRNHVSHVSYGEAEALTDELDEESRLLEEAVRIKEILDDSREQSVSTLVESLRRLQLMPFSIEILKASEIGKSVNALRKHGSKEIHNLVKTLVGDWKIMVDEWANCTKAIAGKEVATDSVKTPAFAEEEGLPSPPMDEGVFLTTPTSLELSQFFDGMDDDGIGDLFVDPPSCGEFNKNQENRRKLNNQTPQPNKVHETGRKPTPEKSSVPKFKDHTPYDSSARLKDRIGEQKKDPEAAAKKQGPVFKPNRLPNGEVGLEKPRPALQNKAKSETNVQQKPNKDMMQRKEMLPQQDKSRVNNEALAQVKLETAKRKLQERYQEVENAKKQRTVQVVEFCDLPKHGLVKRNQHMRLGNNNRQRAYGRA